MIETSRLIKTISIISITAALGLEIWNIYLHFNHEILPKKLNPIFWLGTVALIAHGVEGFIAAFNASSRDRNPFNYGIYTFFVGYIGLQELFARSPKV